MARFRCASCDRNGEFVYDPTGSSAVVFALTIDELPEEVCDALASAERPDDDECDGELRAALDPFRLAYGIDARMGPAPSG
jgi:hypothetical protein